MKKLLLTGLLFTSCALSVSAAPAAPTPAPSSNPLICRINAEIPSLLGRARTLDPKVLDLALTAYLCAKQYGYNDPRQVITIIDYTKPTIEKRLWVVDLQTKQVLFNTLVAQGKGTGGFIARHFSNIPESKASSIGLFVTEEPYYGHDGLSLRIKGLDVGFNDRAESREIVIHGAWYVSEAFARQMGRLGESWGCPAVSKDVIKPLIDTIKEGTLVFSYYPNRDWLKDSKFLHCGQTVTQTYLRSFSSSINALSD